MKPGKQLYQWDVNQFLIELQPTAEFVDYPMGNEVIRIKSDGTRCRIPDEVLQTYGGKTCYERYPDGTFRAYSFTVLYSPKPPDYVFTPEERTTFEALTARVDSAIEEIKRRADSGEFTPVKGVDYFTDAEKNELMESVSTGAIGEFRKVVDTATTEYNDNHNLMLDKYNANAAEKLTTYDTHAEQHTTDYNANAAEKLEAYNQNHAAKVAEYNQNAETKTAEFDANAAAMQTEVDRLRGECDQLAAENRKQENRISALMKLNKGQTYDILPEEGETASRTAPSGAKYVSVDKVGGKSIVWNQLVQNGDFATDGYWSSYNDDYATYTRENKTGKIVVNSVPTDAVLVMMQNYDNNSEAHLPEAVVGHKYLFSANVKVSESISMQAYNSNNGLPAKKLCPANEWTTIIGINEAARKTMYMCMRPSYLDDIKVGLTFYAKNAFNIDLTKMFGSTIADYIYSLEQSQAGAGVEWFKKLFPDDYYPYSEPTIISSQTDRVDVARADGTTSQQITTGFPALNSAGSVYDYIDMDGGKVIRNVYTVELETLVWNRSDNKFRAVLPAKAKVSGNYNTKNNELCNKYEPITMNELFAGNVGIATNPINGETVWIYDNNYETPEQLVTSLSGAVLHYELATPTTEPVTIPEALQEWLPVEAGGTVTFRNADESKQLPVPNAVSWVRKLNEVE